jgi:hypothetical protein
MNFMYVIRGITIIIYNDVRGRDLGMEGTRGGRESARKIFEMGDRSGQRNPDYIVREECKRNQLSESGKENGKV